MTAEREVKKKKKEYVENIIPHRLNMVEIMYLALTKMTFVDDPKPMEIRVDGEVMLKGCTTKAFTHPAIEAGIVNARALLEFLGLKVDPKNPTKLKARNQRRDDDLVIEDFNDGTEQLAKVTIEDVKARYPDPEEAEKALAGIIDIGNKEIVHSTLGHKHTNDVYATLEIAARGIIALTVSFFFTKLGKPAPPSCVNCE